MSYLVSWINALNSFTVALGALLLIFSLGRYNKNPIASRIRLLPLSIFLTSGILGFYISIFPTGDGFWILRAILSGCTALVLFYLSWYFSGLGGRK